MLRFNKYNKKGQLRMKQTIYISLDDSGKLSNKEKISVYGGIIFFKKEDLDKFLYDYEQLVNKLKEKYFLT